MMAGRNYEEYIVVAKPTMKEGDDDAWSSPEILKMHASRNVKTSQKQKQKRKVLQP